MCILVLEASPLQEGHETWCAHGTEDKSYMAALHRCVRKFYYNKSRQNEESHHFYSLVSGELWEEAKNIRVSFADTYVWKAKLILFTRKKLSLTRNALDDKPTNIHKNGLFKSIRGLISYLVSFQDIGVGV